MPPCLLLGSLSSLEGFGVPRGGRAGAAMGGRG